MLLSEILLTPFILLFLAMVIASLCQHIAAPCAVLLVVLDLKNKSFSINVVP